MIYLNIKIDTNGEARFLSIENGIQKAIKKELKKLSDAGYDTYTASLVLMSMLPFFLEKDFASVPRMSLVYKTSMSKKKFRQTLFNMVQDHIDNATFA